MNYEQFLRQASQVRPSARQLDWYRNPFYAFIHFGPNTFTGREWGDGSESPGLFDPTELDCDEWVAAVKSAGMTGLVLTAKHHDGFCLWPSRFTEHSVKNSPYRGGKGDVVREAAEACSRGGIRFGFYLSPWDRNSKLYGTEGYNGYYKAQLMELLTGYGEVFHVWFDGACGEGESGRRQEYDYSGYIELVRKHQPGATIFNDAGPDVRWVGNEAGITRNAEWAVVPSELAQFATVQTRGALVPGGLPGITNTWQSIGDLSTIQYSDGLCFCPAEVDMSIRPGWFYHENEEPHSLERLFATYLTSVGGNAGFHLNIPPMPNGRFDKRDVKRLAELGQKIRDEFGLNLAQSADISRVETDGMRCSYHVRLPRMSEARYVVLSEDIARGQRVESFLLEKKNGQNGGSDLIYQGTVIGGKRICVLPGGMELQDFTLRILSARGAVGDIKIEVF